VCVCVGVLLVVKGCLDRQMVTENEYVSFKANLKSDGHRHRVSKLSRGTQNSI